MQRRGTAREAAGAGGISGRYTCSKCQAMKEVGLLYRSCAFYRIVSQYGACTGFLVDISFTMRKTMLVDRVSFHSTCNLFNFVGDEVVWARLLEIPSIGVK